MNDAVSVFGSSFEFFVGFLLYSVAVVVYLQALSIK